MDLFDFMFPEQAEAAHLRRIAQNMESSQRQAMRDRRDDHRRERSTQQQLEALQDEVRFLNGLCLALIKTMGEQHALSMADLADVMHDVDSLDGARDQGLDQNVLRGLLGIVTTAEQEPQAEPERPRRPFLRRHRKRSKR